MHVEGPDDGGKPGNAEAERREVDHLSRDTQARRRHQEQILFRGPARSLRGRHLRHAKPRRDVFAETAGDGVFKREGKRRLGIARRLGETTCAETADEHAAENTQDTSIDSSTHGAPNLRWKPWQAAPRACRCTR